MERRTALGIAGGTTLAAAAVIAAVGVNVGLMSDRSGDDSPGSFQPVVAELSQRLEDSSTSTTVAVTGDSTPTTLAGATTDDSTPTTTTTPTPTTLPAGGTAPAGTTPTTRYWDDDDHSDGGWDDAWDDHGGDRFDPDDLFDDDNSGTGSGGRGPGRGPGGGDDYGDWDD